MTQRTLDAESWKRPSREQEDSFREVQVNVRQGRYHAESEELKKVMLRLARENGKVEAYRIDVKSRKGVAKAFTRYRGGFTAPQAVEEAGGVDRYPYWLPGVVAGWLSDQGIIQVGCGGLARENSSNGSRKGGKVNRWELAEKAIAEVPEPTMPEVPT